MKKKIAILINSIEGGGAERTAARLLNELKNDFDIHLVLLSDIIDYPIPELQKIFCFNQANSANILIKFLTLPYYAYRYKKYCKRNKIEASLSFLTRSHYINSLSKVFGSQTKILISEQAHVSTYLRSLGKLNEFVSKFLTRKLYSKADLVITNAVLIKTDLQEEFGIVVPFEVVHNPLPLENIQHLSLEPVAEHFFKDFTFINVGSFRPQKNHALLIEAFDKIRHHDCSLLLVGKEGKNELLIHQKVKDLKLDNRIFFAGFDTNPFKYLSKADCFVLSSDFEGFPNVLQEALACHLPVISTDCKSGPREILAPGTDIHQNLRSSIELAEFGILVPVNDAVLLAKAMAMILSDHNLQFRYKEKAFESIKDFDTPLIIDKFRKILSRSL